MRNFYKFAGCAKKGPLPVVGRLVVVALVAHAEAAHVLPVIVLSKLS